MTDKTKSELSRRRVFASAGAVGALAAAAVVLPKAQSPAGALTASAGLTPEQKGGYQVTEHVLRYYQTARV